MALIPKPRPIGQVHNNCATTIVSESNTNQVGQSTAILMLCMCAGKTNAKPTPHNVIHNSRSWTHSIQQHTSPHQPKIIVTKQSHSHIYWRRVHICHMHGDQMKNNLWTVIPDTLKLIAYHFREHPKHFHTDYTKGYLWNIIHTHITNSVYLQITRIPHQPQGSLIVFWSQRTLMEAFRSALSH